ncbi:MAG: molecular chaperone HscB [Flavobacteriales bacterium]|jgi:molecular chaperone HscB
MKRINEYKKLFKVEGVIELSDLKKTYRGLVKENHPDKFQDEEKKAEAESNSVKIIDGYHFLVSIAPETREANLEEYQATIKSNIDDIQHKSMLLEVTFNDGNTYEYFGVTGRFFNKFSNSKSLNNFGKRNVFSSFIYRKSMKGATAE